MTKPDSAAGGLLARVMVNRIWQHYFQRGIVATNNNFGRTGSPPTHPELLDWLATELIHSDWRLKPLHRQILNSTAYRQASSRVARKEVDGIDQATSAPLSMDPENRLLWHMPLRRLESEAIHDAILVVAESLDRTMGDRHCVSKYGTRRAPL